MRLLEGEALSGQMPDLWKKEAEDRVKVCLGDRESESVREIKKVRRICSNPIEKEIL